MEDRSCLTEMIDCFLHFTQRNINAAEIIDSICFGRLVARIPTKRKQFIEVTARRFMLTQIVICPADIVECRSLSAAITGGLSLGKSAVVIFERLSGLAHTLIDRANVV